MMATRRFPTCPAALCAAFGVLFAVLASCALQPASTTGSIRIAIPTAALSMAATQGVTGSGWILRYLLVTDAEYAPLQAYDGFGYPEARPIIPAYYGSHVMGEISIGSQFTTTTNPNGATSPVATQNVIIEGIPPKKQVHLIIQLTYSSDTYYQYSYSSGNADIYSTNAWIFDTPALFDIDEGVLTTVTAANPQPFYSYTNYYTC